jgi:hypothetical protein
MSKLRQQRLNLGEDDSAQTACAAIDQVGAGECMAERVRAAATGDARPGLQALEHLLDTTRAQRSTAAGAEDWGIRVGDVRVPHVAH